VGSLAVARLCESLGTPFTLGGIAWERFAIDPHPGPRSVAEIRGARALGDRAMLAGPETTTPEEIPFAEAGMAAYLGTETLLLDVAGGALGAAAAIEDAVEALGCDLVIGVDVGGDVLARGGEPGLQSPLCDAVMVAAMLEASRRAPALLAVIGAGCDGELSVANVLERVGDLGRAGAWLGTWSPTPEIAGELADAAAAVPTEASLQVARCARGETGEAYIRGGRRRIELGPVGALAFFFDLEGAADELPLARAVAGTETIEEARAALAALGVRTELDYERERAAAVDAQKTGK
jgi:hypothetical protein